MSSYFNGQASMSSYFNGILFHWNVLAVSLLPSLPQPFYFLSILCLFTFLLPVCLSFTLSGKPVPQYWALLNWFLYTSQTHQKKWFNKRWKSSNMPTWKNYFRLLGYDFDTVGVKFRVQQESKIISIHYL